MTIALDQIVSGDCRNVLQLVEPHSVDLSFWSPPYYVGKSYEQHMSFEDWKDLVSEVIVAHGRILRPGGAMVVNIGDILCFPDLDIPRFQADNIRGKRNPVTREQVMAMQTKCPDANRRELARMLGCSEQTVQRRLEGNNVRGGKYSPTTKVVLTGCMIEQWATNAGLYLYGQRIWRKDPLLGELPLALD